jgi:uncharacterized protein
MTGNKPQRSCLGCGATRDKGDLLRFVLSPDGCLTPDLKGKLPGRGAYICPQRSCLGLTIKKKRFASSFKTPIQGLDQEKIINEIRTMVTERVRGYLSLAAKAGNVFSGSDSVAGAVRGGKVGVVFIATDLSEESRKKFSAMAGHAGANLVAMFDKDTLGTLIGKEHRGVVAVESGGFIQPIRRELEIYRNFFDGEV